MRMAANIKVGLLFLQDVFHLRHVVARIAAYVGHIDIHVFDMEEQAFGILHPDDMVVDVAMHGAQWLEGGQGISRLDAANIARVPQLVDVFEEMEELRYEGAVRI